MPKRIQVIVNPASGQPEPILNTLNGVFQSAGVEWDISLTRQSDDAKRFAEEAIANGVDIVAAYGGDGTVMEVANGVMEGETPMAILPGGTANLMAVEIGIPKSLEKAAEIACSEESKVRYVDIGLMGERKFLLKVGIGFDAEKVKIADREMKDRFGILAYTIGGLKALQELEKAIYRVEIDGESFEVEGITCMVDNAGNYGVSWASAAKDISVSDGLLDVILIRDTRFSSAMAAADSVVGREPDPNFFYHWQGREISISTEPALTVHGDGEIWGETPLEIKIKPQAIPILVPGEPEATVIDKISSRAGII
ncbi:MAG: diacylglycerol kinase family lipid kinase, partial [Anaerolineales bacterium]